MSWQRNSQLKKQYNLLVCSHILDCVRIEMNVLCFCRLQGNPLCTFTGGFVNISPELCNTTKPTMERAWVSPMVSKNTCQNMICGNRFYLNPLQCRCSKPLVVTLEVRSPSFTNINDSPLWDSFKNQTVTSLKTLTQHETPPLQFESEQLWIRDASLMAMC